MKKFFLTILTALGLMSSSLLADIPQNQIISTSMTVLKVFNQDYNGTDKEHILPKLFKRQNVKAVAIIPDLVKAGVIVTGQKGEGIFCVRNEDGSWSDPIFVDYKGLGIGTQAGYISNDAVLLFANRRSYTGLFTRSATLEVGGNVSIGGGESKHNLTDLPRLGADILAVGRSDGVFMGMDISSARITVNDQNNIDYYQRMYQNKDILAGSPRDSKLTKDLKRVLTEVFTKQ